MVHVSNIDLNISNGKSWFRKNTDIGHFQAIDLEFFEKFIVKTVVSYKSLVRLALMYHASKAGITDFIFVKPEYKNAKEWFREKINVELFEVDEIIFYEKGMHQSGLSYKAAAILVQMYDISEAARAFNPVETNDRQEVFA
jgi:hypothetical protein